MDWKIGKGYIRQWPQTLPIIPGWDAAGIVEQVGSKVTKFKVGDEVYSYKKRVCVWCWVLLLFVDVFFVLFVIFIFIFKFIYIFYFFLIFIYYLLLFLKLCVVYTYVYKIYLYKITFFVYKARK